MNELMAPTGHLRALPYGELVVPSLVADQGERAAKRYIEFFAAQIRNPNTRRAYARAANDFLGWCEQRGLTLPTIEPVHAAAYIEQLLQVGLPRPPRPRQPGRPPAPLTAPSVKQQLKNGGLLERVQQMAAHSSPRTTKLYDRTQDEVTLDEVERIVL